MKKETQEDIIDIYQRRIADLQLELDQNTKLSTRYSYIRLGLVILAIPIIYLLLQVNLIGVITGILVIIFLFVQAVLRQQKYDRLVQASNNLIDINRNEIQNILHHSNIYYNGAQYGNPHHYYSEDLDLFGPNSLFALTNRCRTYDGSWHSTFGFK